MKCLTPSLYVRRACGRMKVWQFTVNKDESNVILWNDI